ncbi:MAG: hypothetical protein VB144_02325 [Clostridia bacterium]|nr:hypothetical protein [Clostridia bacterium]
MVTKRDLLVALILAALYYPTYYVVYGMTSSVLWPEGPIQIGALAAGLIIGLAGASLGLRPAWKVLMLPLVAEALGLIVNTVIFKGLDIWRQAIYGSVEGGVGLPIALWWHSCGFLIASVGSGTAVMIKAVADHLR